MRHKTCAQCVETHSKSTKRNPDASATVYGLRVLGIGGDYSNLGMQAPPPMYLFGDSGRSILSPCTEYVLYGSAGYIGKGSPTRVFPCVPERCEQPVLTRVGRIGRTTHGL
jgi:hypothetical protein